VINAVSAVARSHSFSDEKLGPSRLLVGVVCCCGARTEVLAYLSAKEGEEADSPEGNDRKKSRGNNRSKNNSRSPAGMTTKSKSNDTRRFVYPTSPDGGAVCRYGAPSVVDTTRRLGAIEAPRVGLFLVLMWPG
jgi:hypothetical protein